MSNLFRHHTPSTELQQAIDKVTDGHQLSEDWGSIMKICDYVAAHDDRYLFLFLFFVFYSFCLDQKKQ